MAGRSSFGFLGRFGRSWDLRVFDEELRRCDVHPAQVPEGVKLAAVRIVQQFQADAEEPTETDYQSAAGILAFCIRGEAGLAAVVDARHAALQAQRVEQATENEDGKDAALVLLALHAGLVAPEVQNRFDLAIGPG